MNEADSHHSQHPIWSGTLVVIHGLSRPPHSHLTRHLTPCPPLSFRRRGSTGSVIHKSEANRGDKSRFIYTFHMIESPVSPPSLLFHPYTSSLADAEWLLGCLLVLDRNTESSMTRRTGFSLLLGKSGSRGCSISMLELILSRPVTPSDLIKFGVDETWMTSAYESGSCMSESREKGLASVLLCAKRGDMRW